MLNCAGYTHSHDGIYWGCRQERFAHSGGKYLELLAKADVLLIDKTGTLTLGRPRITDILPLNGMTEDEILVLAASAERYSEHPLAKALLDAMGTRKLEFKEISEFQVKPGLGIHACVNGQWVTIGNDRLVNNHKQTAKQVEKLVQQGKSILYMDVDGELVGILAASDSMREEVPAALKTTMLLGMKTVELLTGDNENTANEFTRSLGIPYRANLLPEDKIRIVKEYQSKGHTVMMVGDGINDAPALAQADIGMAMGAKGTDIAKETSGIVLLRDDWRLVPQVIGIAKRTMNVVKMNLFFTAIYNIVGISLAAFGILPPVLAAALQSVPDLGLLGNSSRLLKPKQVKIEEEIPSRNMI